MDPHSGATMPNLSINVPEEVAEAVLALVSNPFITAQTISVDGGMHPR